MLIQHIYRDSDVIQGIKETTDLCVSLPTCTAASNVQEEKRKVPEVQEEKRKVPEVQEEKEKVPGVQEEKEKVELPVIGGKKERIIKIPVTKEKEDTKMVEIHDISSIRKRERYVPVKEGVRCGTPAQQHDWLGFPNPGNLCYMNSSLQGLLTLKDFIRDLSQQQQVWSHLPEAEIIRRFMNIVGCHRSADLTLKFWALLLFKKALSVGAPEFRNNHQKDAHEFLTTVLDQMRSVAPQLQDIAACLGRGYRCPVEEHLVFRMQNTRTCRTCGARSIREEDYTNLSLKLLPGASVGDMLQGYLMETELDFRCDCGSNRSVQQPAFKTLPKVLILHVRRICFTPSMQLMKLSDPVTIFIELMVTSTEDIGWYSLVGIINHLGNNANRHYISDVLHPETGLDDPSDRWLTCNDGEVTRTTGEAVCQQRKDTAFILFYQRRQCSVFSVVAVDEGGLRTIPGEGLRGTKEGRGRLRARTGIRKRADAEQRRGTTQVLKLEDQQMMRPAAERGPPLSTGPQEEGLLPESQVPPEVSSRKREFFLAAVASESLPGP
ncbi:Ubiquitin carboxyl-terminal hydrolase 37, partial [Dissostichus eleginoides]